MRNKRNLLDRGGEAEASLKKTKRQKELKDDGLLKQGVVAADDDLPIKGDVALAATLQTGDPTSFPTGVPFQAPDVPLVFQEVFPFKMYMRPCHAKSWPCLEHPAAAL